MLLLFDSVLSFRNTLLEILQIYYGHKLGNNLFNATNIRTFEARHNYKMEIIKRLNTEKTQKVATLEQ